MGKRIVSKSVYVQAQGQKSVMAVSGTTLVSLAIVGCLATIIGALLCFTFLILTCTDLSFLTAEIAVLILTLSVAALTYGSWIGGNKMLEQADKIDPGIPITRAKMADLPATDTLVRASSEPMQAQEAVLLRAAAPGQETPPEQLLRATQSMME